MVARSSLGLQMVGDRALLANDEVTGLAEMFDEFQNTGLNNFDLLSTGYYKRNE